MRRGQTNQADQGSTRRLAAIGATLLVIVVGLTGLIRPFVRSATTWRWDLQAPADLTGASVNAELIRIDTTGASLAPQGARHISLITPPLTLPDRSGRLVRIEASLPNVPDDRPKQTRVVLLWQIEPVERFSFAEQTVPLCHRPRAITFSLPVSPSAVYRLGVQFPGVREVVQVRSIALPDASVRDRLRLFIEQATAREMIRGHSINFLRGPSILGHTFNYFLISALLAALGTYAFVRVVRGRRVCRRTIGGIVLVFWLLSDLQATKNLSRQYHAERAELYGKSWPEQIALIEGGDIAWAYVQLLRHAAPGSTFAVVSDDRFTPSHRLGYLLAPARTRRLAYESADYIVVMGAAEAVYDEEHMRFQWKQSPPMTARRIAVLSPDVYLLRRISP